MSGRHTYLRLLLRSWPATASSRAHFDAKLSWGRAATGPTSQDELLAQFAVLGDEDARRLLDQLRVKF
jgi:hypothetical protein